MTELNWAKGAGLLPAIVQDCVTGAVLMLGYMNEEALAATRASARVTFWSRSKKRLWTKGETSGNFLELKSIAVDCDGDTLLISAKPHGPACHLGTATCWGDTAPPAQRLAFLGELEDIIADRIATQPPGSYTAQLLGEGTRRIAQKVGEEALELALASIAQSDGEIIGEAADLLYHMLLLLKVKGLSLSQVAAELDPATPVAMPALPEVRIVIAKQARELALLLGSTTKRTYPIVLGRNALADKAVEGDEATPLGEFYVCAKNPRSRYFLSLCISYPNAEHAARGVASGLIGPEEHAQILQALQARRVPPQHTRLGGEIYIHGRGEHEDGRGTRGCISLSNEHMRELYDEIALGTVVSIRE